MGSAVAQTALADIGGLDNEMRRHREIAEQHFADGNIGMLFEAITSPKPHTGTLPKPSGSGNSDQYFN